MESNVFKLSNAGGMSSRTRYWSMLAGNTTWVPFTPSGSFESIATVTVGAGGSSTISFSSIPSTYQHLQVRFNGSITTSGGAMGIYFNSDSTSTNYYQHTLYGNGSSAAANAGNNYAYGPQLDSTYSGGSAGIIDILDYASVNKVKVVRNISGYDANGSGYVMLRSGMWIGSSATAITGITLVPPAGNFAQYSVAALYGVK